MRWWKGWPIEGRVQRAVCTTQCAWKILEFLQWQLLQISSLRRLAFRQARWDVRDLRLSTCLIQFRTRHQSRLPPAPTPWWRRSFAVLQSNSLS